MKTLNEKNIYSVLNQCRKFKPKTETVIVIPKKVFKQLKTILFNHPLNTKNKNNDNI